LRVCGDALADPHRIHFPSNEPLYLKLVSEILVSSGKTQGRGQPFGRNDEGRRDDATAPTGGKRPTTGVRVLPSASFLSLVGVAVSPAL
jgi:hypothetical protein